jgi:hypothetical protein
LGACIDQPAVFFTLAVDTAVIHELPDPSIRSPDLIGLIVATHIGNGGVKVCGSGLCRLFPGDAGKLHLNAKFSGKHLA